MHYRVELVGADLSASIRRIENMGVMISNVEPLGEFTIRFTVAHQDKPILRNIAAKCGDDLKIISADGYLFIFKRLILRPVLLIGLALLLAITLWLPGRVLFVSIEGNERIPANRIQETASSCGIRIGALTRDVRSEAMKNALLAAMPQLQWAGVNTKGCVATITVREREDITKTEIMYDVSSIVAARDGVVRQITVLRGNRLCEPGQAVKAGQVLISGYNDCGIFLQATAAEGEVLAETRRDLTVICPSVFEQKRQISTIQKKYSLIIGKNRINFYNSSGILGTSCAKIYEQKSITLPGGFALPINLVTETWYTYEQESVSIEIQKDQMAVFAREYVASQMIGGRICSEYFEFKQIDDGFRLDGIFGCTEMIGLRRREEILTEYESN